MLVCVCLCVCVRVCVCVCVVAVVVVVVWFSLVWLGGGGEGLERGVYFYYSYSTHEKNNEIFLASMCRDTRVPLSDPTLSLIISHCPSGRDK